MKYFQVNAAGIGALCTVISLIAYIYFQKLLNSKTKQDDEQKQKIEKLESSIGNIESAIKSISNKLDKG